MKTFRLLLILSSLLFAGCASNPMMVSGDMAVSKPEEGKSQVVFMRDSFLGSAISASLYDVTGSDIVFVGIIANGTKVAYQTSPGKHTFMVVSEAADFLEADFAPGKTYYSIVTPRMGAWKARFSMWPIKNNPNAEFNIMSADFEKWKSNTKVATVTEQAKSWFASNKSSVMAKQNKYWPVWQEKSKADIAKRTFDPEDGL